MRTGVTRLAFAVALAAMAAVSTGTPAGATATASYAGITAATPTVPGSCTGVSSGCVTVSAAVTTAKTGTLPASISVTFTLCKGTSTSSCTKVYAWPAIVVYPSPYKSNTKYTVTASYKCAKTGTASYFVKAIMSNTSTTVTDYSTPRSQNGCTS